MHYSCTLVVNLFFFSVLGYYLLCTTEKCLFGIIPAILLLRALNCVRSLLDVLNLLSESNGLLQEQMTCI